MVRVSQCQRHTPTQLTYRVPPTPATVTSFGTQMSFASQPRPTALMFGANRQTFLIHVRQPQSMRMRTEVTDVKRLFSVRVFLETMRNGDFRWASVNSAHRLQIAIYLSATFCLSCEYFSSVRCIPGKCSSNNRMFAVILVVSSQPFWWSQHLVPLPLKVLRPLRRLRGDYYSCRVSLYAPLLTYLIDGGIPSPPTPSLPSSSPSPPLLCVCSGHRFSWVSTQLSLTEAYQFRNDVKLRLVASSLPIEMANVCKRDLIARRTSLFSWKNCCSP